MIGTDENALKELAQIKQLPTEQCRARPGGYGI
jgi:hypothetical protein